MVQKDYVMRLIREMVRAILKMLFQIDTESPTAELLEEKEEREMLEKLYHMVDDGQIDEAENCVSDIISDGEMRSLKLALLFYSYLNDKTDDFLETRNFSRDEVKLGLEDLVDKYKLGSIANVFLEES